MFLFIPFFIILNNLIGKHSLFTFIARPWTLVAVSDKEKRLCDLESIISTVPLIFNCDFLFHVLL